MIKHLLLDCCTVIKNVHESDENNFSIFTQILIKIHLLFCSDCTEKLKNLRFLENTMKIDFFPPAPGIEESVMTQLYKEIDKEMETEVPIGFSIRSWVIVGFFVLFSLSSSFLSINFINIANAEGLSFLLPISITIGMVLTCYGALFIGSHLKELTTHFKLH